MIRLLKIHEKWQNKQLPILYKHKVREGHMEKLGTGTIVDVYKRQHGER